MKNKKMLISLCLLTIIFCFLFVLVWNKYSFITDSLLSSLVLNIRCELLNKIMLGITYLGSEYAYIFLLLLGFIFIRDRLIPLLVAGGLMVSTFAFNLIKFIVKRPRPLDGLILENGFSFPSGHSLSAVFFYGFLIYFVFKNIKNVKLKKILLVFICMIILLIGFSRIYLGVHFVSDVIAGFVLGLIILIVFINYIYKKVFE